MRTVEHIVRKVERSARRVAEGDLDALAQLSFWQNELHNALPRDENNVPV